MMALGHGLCNGRKLCLTAVENILALLLNVSGFGKRHFGKGGADDLIDQHAEENNVAHKSSVCAQSLGSGRAHAQRHACLGQQRNAQIAAHHGVAFGKAGTPACAKNFADGSRQDIQHAHGTVSNPAPISASA